MAKLFRKCTCVEIDRLCTEMLANVFDHVELEEVELRNCQNSIEVRIDQN
jgi:hypothetical protein